MGIIDELYKQREEIDLKIKTVQEECSHPESCLTRKYNANTGNFDPQDDSYWVTKHCSLCDRRWKVEE